MLQNIILLIDCNTSKLQVIIMLIVGWFMFLGGWMVNILMYILHPSSVDFSPKRFKEKCFLYLFGQKIFLFTASASKPLNGMKSFIIFCIFLLFFFFWGSLINYTWLYKPYIIVNFSAFTNTNELKLFLNVIHLS